MNALFESLNTSHSIDGPLQRIIEEALQRLQDGESIDVNALATAHPAYAEELRELLPTIAALVQFGDRTGEVEWLETTANGHAAQGAQQLGDFRIIREIGRGGMGVVYEAEQLSLGRRVALKVLPFAAMLGDQQMQRFKNEARAAATLKHPHIVSVYSVGCERGVHFYAMELVKGCSLDQVLHDLRRQESGNDTRSPSHGEITETVRADLLSTCRSSNPTEYFRSVARIGIAAAEALEHAHQQGIVHRDVKPANMLLDEAGKLWLTDFGLARLEADAGLTMTGDLVGTLRYMSPEQALGQATRVDNRSDVYSLGLTLYELATLRCAYSADNRNDLLRQIAFEEPKPARHFERRLPTDLDRIICKAIEKQPIDRYPTAQLLADDLRRYLEHKPVKAKPPTALRRFTKWTQRHPGVAGISALATVLLLIVISVVAADRRRQVQSGTQFVRNSLHAARAALEEDQTQAATQRLGEARTRIDADRLTDKELHNEFDALVRESERYTQLITLLENAKETRGSTIQPATKRCAELYGLLDETPWQDELRAAGLPERHISRVADALYQVLLLMADSNTRWQGHIEDTDTEAQEQLKHAERCLQKAAACCPPSRGYYWLLANCAALRGDLEDEVVLRQKAAEAPVHHAAELFYINRDARWGKFSHNRGLPSWSLSDSLKLHRETLQFDPSYFNAMFFSAYELLNSDRFEESLMVLDGCVSMQPSDPSARYNRALIHLELGNFDMAAADFEKALDDRWSTPFRAYAWWLATGPDEYRNPQRALELALRACQISEYQDASHLEALAAAYAALGQFENAVRWAEEANQLDGELSYSAQIESYKNNIPWRESSLVSATFDKHLHVANQLLQDGEKELAFRLYKSIARKAPRVPNPWYEIDFDHDPIAMVQLDELYTYLADRQSHEEVHLARLHWLASAGRWKDMPEVFDKLLALESTGYKPWAEAAAVSFFLGDETKYRQLCQDMLTQFGDGDAAPQCEQVARACLLSEQDHGTFDEAYRLADRAVAEGESHEARLWFHFVKGLAEYRKGNFEEAERYARHSSAQQHPALYLKGRILQAMALHRLNQREAAEQTLKTADKVADFFMPRFGDLGGKVVLHWPDWLRVKILRAEAEKLFADANENP